ncbi:glutamine and serine-rich protein 1 isoform X3 [Rhinoderma darwinii]|uniref:glutamine and serine-rich protein 1 isoform X3 n=1 Tax=Rhinoderma darwinii TaxID=43563 RepID=UPI003F664660
MMDRNYPTPTFTDPLAPASPAAWAYERSAAGIKPSLSYGAGHPSHSETELLHRQTYAATHQLPGYATSHHPTGLSGLFDTGLHMAGGTTTETSVMNFLSAIESRTAQAASSGTTLLPQFRAPSWQTGMHSSTAAELFVTGALQTSGTFPTSALSAYQHPNTFSSRNFATTPSLSLQDGTFSAATNGLLSHHDPLLQIKTSQAPTALTFERLGSAVLSTSIPQSSTYRSAQESAPHLLQPQFSLLPSALGGSQQTVQPYSTSVFTGSTASIERALQRECSVIKHHQRPSSTQSVQAQLSGTQHSLQNYLASATGAVLQDTSRQSALLCAPLGALTQVSNGGPVQKTPQVSVELSQSYPSVIPSPGFPPSSTKSKNCPTKAPPRSSKTPKSQSVASPGHTQSYIKSSQNQSSVISSQAQAFSSQLSSLLPVSQSPSYVSTQSPNLPSASQSQVFSTIKSEKLPPLYKPLSAFSSQSQTITSGSQTLSYSTDQTLTMPSVSSANYSDQTRDLSSANQTQSYSSSNTQGLTPVSQSQVSYSSQSQVMSPVSPSDSYNSGQNLPLSSPSLPYSASSRGQTLSASSPTQNYISMHSSQTTQDSTSPQSQKFLPTVPSSSFSSPPHSQALQNSRTTADSKSYVKRKSETNLYASVKQEEKFQMSDLQALQQQTNIESSTQGLNDGEMNTQETAYSVSKADDRYSQSVIKSSSRLEDQVLGLQGPKKDERMMSPVGHMSQHVGHMNSSSHDAKNSTDLIQPTQVSAKDLSQHNMLHKVHETKLSEQPSTSPQLQAVLRHPQHLQLQGTQVLLDSDLQMFQQSILQSNLGQAKTPSSMQRIQSPQHVAPQFLQMDGHIIQSNGGQPQALHSQSSDVIKMDTSDGKHLQQHLQSKDFGQRQRLDSKNQFESLNPMCFTESMLLSDERNFLSHVDDILAATAAQEFAKSSSEDNLSVKPDDSKSRFQSLNIRNTPANFTSPKQQNLNTLSLNGGQTAINLSTVSTTHSKNASLDQNQIQPLEQDLPSGMGSPVLGTSQDDHEQNSERSKKNDTKDANDVAGDIGDSDFLAGTKNLNDENAASDGDFIMNTDENAVQHMSKSDPQAGSSSSGQMEEDCQDLAQDGLQKIKGKDKMALKHFSEDENANVKQGKRNVQMKRPLSKGPDVGMPYSSHVSEGYYDSYQHQERMRQKIKEVEEKQPEVKTGFIASFLDFLKTGPKQQFSAPAVRVPNRIRRPCTPVIKSPCPGPIPPPQSAGAEVGSSPKKTEEEFKKNLEALPSFSSDDDDSVGGNNDLQKSITTALSALDENGEKKNKAEGDKTATSGKQESPPVPSPRTSQEKLKVVEAQKSTQSEPTPSEQLAKPQELIALEGFTDDEGTESGGEGIYRERDEFVVKIEDIDMLKEALYTGKEPPAIWKVQKALLQKFIPEIREGQRAFAATNSYLGYFGDAKTKYKRVYVKFVENANKKEYVRVCSKKPKSKAAPIPRNTHTKVNASNKASTETPPQKNAPPKVVSAKPKAKQPKTKAEPPPKKRKQWKEEFSSSQSDSSPDMQSDEEGEEWRIMGRNTQKFEPPPPPIVTRFLNTRAMKETFKGYVELLVGIALDADVMQNLEKDNDDVLLPHMRKIEGMLNENRRRLLAKLQMDPPLKNALENYPDITTINREGKGKSGGASVCKIKVHGKWYNKKTMRPTKTASKQSQEFTVDPEKSQLCSLYHALHHYKYHIYIICKDEVTSVQKSNRDLQRAELVNHCLKNMKWVEDLFEKFGELLSRVQQTCS